MDKPTFVLVVVRDGQTLFWQKYIIKPRFVPEYPDAYVTTVYNTAQLQRSYISEFIHDDIQIVENYGMENERCM